MGVDLRAMEPVGGFQSIEALQYGCVGPALFKRERGGLCHGNCDSKRLRRDVSRLQASDVGDLGPDKCWEGRSRDSKPVAGLQDGLG